MDVTATLLTTYEAFPQFFTDDQFNIPDKFDEKFHILGKGNGIPDIIDEAEWGAMFWLYMQEPSGAIHWGTETQGYSPFTTYDKDTKKFGTELTQIRSASFAAGIRMHLARIIKPYKAECAARSSRSAAELAMSYAAAAPATNARDRLPPTHKLYFAVQKYLLTGDEAAHQTVKDLAGEAAAYASTYNGAPESFADRGWLASFFFSYIVEKNRPTDPKVVAAFKDALKAAADKEIGYLQGTPTLWARRSVWDGGEATRPRDSMPIRACSSGR